MAGLVNKLVVGGNLHAKDEVDLAGATADVAAVDGTDAAAAIVTANALVTAYNGLATKYNALVAILESNGVLLHVVS